MHTTLQIFLADLLSHFCCGKTISAAFSMWCKYEQMFEGYWKFCLGFVIGPLWPHVFFLSRFFVSSSSGILIIPTTTSMDSFIVATSFAASLEPRRWRRRKFSRLGTSAAVLPAAIESICIQSQFAAFFLCKRWLFGSVFKSLLKYAADYNLTDYMISYDTFSRNFLLGFTDWRIVWCFRLPNRNVCGHRSQVKNVKSGVETTRRPERWRDQIRKSAETTSSPTSNIPCFPRRTKTGAERPENEEGDFWSSNLSGWLQALLCQDLQGINFSQFFYTLEGICQQTKANTLISQEGTKKVRGG